MAVESAARVDARTVRWDRVRHITPRRAVITGDSAADTSTAGEPDEDGTSTGKPVSINERRADPLRSRPLLIFIHTDPDACDGQCKGACQRYFDADGEMFSSPKVGLATLAFRCVWMTPEDAAADPLLADTTEHLPRLVVLDVAREESSVLHGKALKAKRAYAQMKKASDRFYKERLDRTVKKHLKFLDTYDKLAQKEMALQERMSRTSDLDKVHDLEDELDDLRDEQRDLDREIEDLWEFSLRDL